MVNKWEETRIAKLKRIEPRLGEKYSVIITLPSLHDKAGNDIESYTQPVRVNVEKERAGKTR
ncbi:hypothetical protein A9G26_06210 [Gilliamella sp. Bim1-2]|nr:hypothetical protein A9G32_06445 [Gilliamella apicola]OCG50792.1 hypothetical protein A9G26_06210 [Gilliamella apicola]OCG52466.1 hypothetical protein A9G27_09845 [Gilliamella apicola]